MEAVRLAGGSGKWLWLISYQLYLHRTEHLVVVRGTARVIKNRHELLLYEDKSVYIPNSIHHLVEGPSKIKSKFVELQIEGIRKEDNIVGAQNNEDFNF